MTHRIPLIASLQVSWDARDGESGFHWEELGIAKPDRGQASRLIFLFGWVDAGAPDATLQALARASQEISEAGDLGWWDARDFQAAPPIARPEPAHAPNGKRFGLALGASAAADFMAEWRMAPRALEILNVSLLAGPAREAPELGAAAAEAARRIAARMLAQEEPQGAWVEEACRCIGWQPFAERSSWLREMEQAAAAVEAHEIAAESNQAKIPARSKSL